jgi:two-component system, NtrC family, response regulator PilR
MNKYDFPGNVRELENLMERSVALTSTNIILPESLALSVHKRRWIEGVEGKRYDLDDVAKGIALDVVLREIEYAYLKKGLEVADGNKNRAAELLGITFRSFRHRLGKMADDK